MRLVVDAIAVQQGSAAIVVGNVLAGWVAGWPDDEIVVLAGRSPEFPVPAGVTVETTERRLDSTLGRLAAQSVDVRRACRRLGADALLSGVTASAFLGAPCPHAVIVYDFRHELRPEQFSPARRLARRLLYGWSFRRADALACISERTRHDLVRRRPRWAEKSFAALLGADHADGWRGGGSAASRRYVLAFGHFANKNVDGVLRAWAEHAGGADDAVVLRICGLGGTARDAAQDLVRTLGIDERVELMPWLDDAEFAALFAGASAILFPSDFEGFGLPAVEALRLGIPVVISSDPALLEVTGGHAVVAAGTSPADLAAAIDRALARPAEAVAAGVEHARAFTWQRTAGAIRSRLVAGT
ncbi:MAG TPA: glycosyltransferase family 1 protein [Jatrophihabitans sp.]|jgi:glycosyltransferase involved in cell wall biosynthesis|uniref:glycosyltransferase family 4 protein n=1 Tax=Jatrophihabitans sp. TaxID=1932789 RepID=UPI002E0A1315|nr:glycosyltransferase family 1 protein [Jatrophihabitans sp.]